MNIFIHMYMSVYIYTHIQIHMYVFIKGRAIEAPEASCRRAVLKIRDLVLRNKAHPNMESDMGLLLFLRMYSGPLLRCQLDFGRCVHSSKAKGARMSPW